MSPSNLVRAEVDRWNRNPRLSVYIQGEEDNACGLYCLLTVGAWLGTIKPDGFATDQIWKSIERKRLYEVGLLFEQVEVVAAACGLRAKHTADEVLEQLAQDRPALVYVLAHDVPPRRGTSPLRPFTHYVVALQRVVDEQGIPWVIIADPHPWRPMSPPDAPPPSTPIYAIKTDRLMRAWQERSLWNLSGIESSQNAPGHAWHLHPIAPNA